jgi:hypothetical protein
VSNASEVEEILDAMRRGDWDTAVPRARCLPETAFPEIAARLEQSQDERERELCYRLLTHVAVSSGSGAIGAYAAKRVAVETRDRLTVLALEVVSWTGGVTHCRPIVERLASKNRDVQRWAIRALGACQGTVAEKVLLATLREAANPGIASYAAQALARMCGAAVIPELEAVFVQLPRKKPYESTLEYLIFAFARHPTTPGTELVRAELDSTRLSGVGWACFNYLFREGDAGDAERVASYLKGVLQRLKRGTAVYEYSLVHIDAPFRTEITAALALLNKAETDSIARLIPDLRSLWDSLSPYDRDWLVQLPAGE